MDEGGIEEVLIIGAEPAIDGHAYPGLDRFRKNAPPSGLYCF
jgi:hypothetical protein